MSTLSSISCISGPIKGAAAYLLAVVLLGTLGAVGACGDDDGDSGGTPTTATTTPSTTGGAGGAGAAGGGHGGAAAGSSGVAGSGGAMTCGDGVIDPGEGCDDGNTTNADGCDPLCASEAGFVCSGEPSDCAPICLRMLPLDVFDTSNNCASEPAIDRVLDSTVIHWGGRPYLFVNTGNDLRIYDVENPQQPDWINVSNFNVDNQGDSDYDLWNFSICDDCRYGVAWFKLGTVLFDLGTGSTPHFMEHSIVYGATFSLGGVTFKHGQEQLLATAAGLNNSCTITTTLFRVSGIDQMNDLTNVGCFDVDGQAVLAAGGRYVPGYLYLASSSTKVYLFGVQGSGDAVSLTYLDEPMRAFFGQGSGLAFDMAAGVAVEANSTGAYIWDISNPGAPLKRATIAGDFSRAAVAYPYVFLAKGGIVNTERTFSVGDLSSPLPLDQAFWDPANSWNHPGHFCSQIQMGSISDDGSTLYLMRYSRLEVVDLTAPCP